MRARVAAVLLLALAGGLFVAWPQVVGFVTGEAMDRERTKTKAPEAVDRASPADGASNPTLAVRGRRPAERTDAQEGATAPPARAVVAGSVRSGDGVPIAGALVSPRVPATRVDSSPVVRTGPDGSFRIELGENERVLFVAADGYVRAAIYAYSEPVGGVAVSPLDVRLRRGATIRGIVVDADGRPVTGELASLDGLAGQMRKLMESAEDGAITDAEGRFAIRDTAPMPEGVTTSVVIAANGHARVRSAPFTLAAGATVDVGILRASDGATIRGRVLGVDERPAPTATLHALAMPARGYPYAMAVEVDRDGRFELRHVEAGVVQVQARAEGACMTIARVPVEEPKGAVEATVRLRPIDRIRGTVLDDVGAPVETAWARTISGLLGVDGEFPSFNSVAAKIGPDGAFVIEPVPSGTIRIEVTKPRYRLLRVEASTSAPVVARLVAFTEAESTRIAEIEQEVDAIRFKAPDSSPETAARKERLRRERLRLEGEPDWAAVSLCPACDSGKCG